MFIVQWDGLGGMCVVKVGFNWLCMILWDSNKQATVLAGGWGGKEVVKSWLIQFTLFNGGY